MASSERSPPAKRITARRDEWDRSIIAGLAAERLALG